MFLYLLVLVVGVQSQTISLNRCPNVTTKLHLDLHKFVGKWYESLRSFAWFELNTKCHTVKYTVTKTALLNISMSFMDTKTSMNQTLIGYGSSEYNCDAKFTITFPSMPGDGSPYWILDTDYYDYAIIWSCNDYRIFSMAFCWVLTRTTTPTKDAIAKAYAVLRENKIDVELLLSDQRRC